MLNELLLVTENFDFRPFRQVDVEQETKSWDRVTELKKGQTYEEVL